jgi:hypothetical protein
VRPIRPAGGRRDNRPCGSAPNRRGDRLLPGESARPASAFSRMADSVADSDREMSGTASARTLRLMSRILRAWRLLAAVILSATAGPPSTHEPLVDEPIGRHAPAGCQSRPPAARTPPSGRGGVAARCLSPHRPPRKSDERQGRSRRRSGACSRSCARAGADRVKCARRVPATQLAVVLDQSGEEVPQLAALNGREGGQGILTVLDAGAEPLSGLAPAGVRRIRLRR